MKSITRFSNVSIQPFLVARFSNLCLLLLCSVFMLQSCKKRDFNPPPVGAYDLKLVTDGLVSPLVVTESPDATHRLFVADQPGQVWILDANGNKMPAPFIDISS